MTMTDISALFATSFMLAAPYSALTPAHCDSTLAEPDRFRVLTAAPTRVSAEMNDRDLNTVLIHPSVIKTADLALLLLNYAGSARLINDGLVPTLRLSSKEDIKRSPSKFRSR
jgi:hypothetical protein